MLENMNNVIIEKATHEEKDIAALLTLMAYKDLSYEIFWTRNDVDVVKAYAAFAVLPEYRGHGIICPASSRWRNKAQGIIMQKGASQQPRFRAKLLYGIHCSHLCILL